MPCLVSYGSPLSTGLLGIQIGWVKNIVGSTLGLSNWLIEDGPMAAYTGVVGAKMADDLIEALAGFLTVEAS